MPVEAAPGAKRASVDVREPGAAVAVFGLGFVGLPLSLSFAMEGSTVYGVDVVARLIDELTAGHSLHQESYEGRSLEAILREEKASGRFTPTLDGAWAVGQADTVIITVGIPVVDGKALLDPLTAALKTVGTALRPGHIVILRATVVPGTTEELARPILERASGLVAGVDFDLAYCPERIAEGRAFDEFRTMPTVIAAVTREGAERARRAIARVTRAPIELADHLIAAELSKVVENVQRDVNIAIVQEVARVCEAAGADVREVIALANTHRRVHLLDPGPGVGGYCIPNALHYLRPLAARLQVELPTLESARTTNQAVPRRIAAIALEHARRLGIAPQDARFGLWGLAMKDYTNDDRISPPVEVAHLLAQSGAKVRAFDPAVSPDHPYPAASALEAAEGAHALLVLARQEGMDFADDTPLKALAPGALVLDTRAAYRHQEERLAALGLAYWSI
jgi:UDP-N-acetyl-D-mannosaminuronic acid dehydrogenase